MPRTKNPTKNITINRNWQLAFMLVAILTWLSPLTMLILWSNGGYFSSGTWIIQTTMFLLPVVFFCVAYIYVRKQNYDRFQKLFMAVFISWVGLSAYYLLSSFENIIRYRYFPPVIDDMTDNSLLTAFGHEWLVMGVGIVLFASVLYWFSRTRKA